MNLSDADPSKIAQLDLKGKLVLVGQNPAGFKGASEGRSDRRH